MLLDFSNSVVFAQGVDINRKIIDMLRSMHVRVQKQTSYSEIILYIQQ